MEKLVNELWSSQINIAYSGRAGSMSLVFKDGTISSFSESDHSKRRTYESVKSISESTIQRCYSREPSNRSSIDTQLVDFDVTSIMNQARKDHQPPIIIIFDER